MIAAVIFTAPPSLAAPTAVPAGSTTGPSRADALAGVWASERRFGPAVSGGDVVLERQGAVWTGRTGALRGRLAPGAFGALRFAFAGGSELRVREPAGGAVAQWLQPKTADGEPRYASPVRLRAAGGGTLRGAIRPLLHVEHLFLVVRATDDGGAQAFIRNPEHNAGAGVGLRTVVREGARLRLTRPGKPDLSGLYDARSGMLTLTLQLDGVTSAWTFTRATAAGAAAFYARPGVHDYLYRQPREDGDGWQTASLAAVGLNQTKIAAVMNEILRGGTPSLRAPYIQSVVIARHGKLVLDEYFYGFGADRPHDVRSAGKSVTTLLVGRAIQDGAPLAPQTPVYPLFPEYAPFAHDDPRKASITVEHLMTMSAGYACDDNGDNWAGEDAMQSQTAQPRLVQVDARFADGVRPRHESVLLQPGDQPARRGRAEDHARVAAGLLREEVCGADAVRALRDVAHRTADRHCLHGRRRLLPRARLPQVRTALSGRRPLARRPDHRRALARGVGEAAHRDRGRDRAVRLRLARLRRDDRRAHVPGDQRRRQRRPALDRDPRARPRDHDHGRKLRPVPGVVEVHRANDPRLGGRRRAGQLTRDQPEQAIHARGPEYVCVQYVYTMYRVGKTVPPKRQILKDISLSFLPGAKIGILGLNGAGKSTVLRIMAGVDTDIDGEAIPMPNISIGYLPQEPKLDPERTVRETVEEALSGLTAARARLDEIYAAYGDP
ncbi:MAG: ATP-binding cassette domain-containing protein, partial [Candidatus Eremiobacteraeota bacterium]|nr:ATP-binding cassette domain-containing protein [Candidatus Eremiobacteraeota bacterium]